MKQIEITSKELSDIVKVADENEIDYYIYEGSLQDNFIFHHANEIKINGASTEYIIVKEQYLNAWSSSLVLIMTDSKEEVWEFEKIFEGGLSDD